jgi:hypothetical protein
MVGEEGGLGGFDLADVLVQDTRMMQEGFIEFVRWFFSPVDCKGPDASTIRLLYDWNVESRK